VDTEPCSDRQSACPLCHILGHLDAAQKRSGKTDLYDVRFGNLRLAGDKFFAGPHEIGARRTLNRVDAPTGKAHDWFRVWEIDDESAKRFEGVIEIAGDLANRESVLSLLERSLGFVDRLCGSMVAVTLERKEVSIEDGQGDPSAGGLPVEPVAADPAEIGHILAQMPQNDDVFKARQRTLADAIRALRAEKLPLDLPKGHKGPNGAAVGHFLWDKLKLRDDKQTLRSLLEKAAEKYTDNQAGWRWFCNRLGQRLLGESKASGQVPGNRSSRPMDGIGLVISPKTPASYADILRTGETFTHEWILTGELRAKTPFHVGVEADANEQTSQPVLLGRDNRFRLPRSVLRGVLRRDLGFVTGQGCTVQLGPERPCQCPVCQIMRQIAIRDSKSDISFPPDIRHRIRRNPVSGTVDEGALFDAENGLEGTSFPFTLRFRGGAELPPALRNVLAWWGNGKLFLGGNVGTGKGRFTLEKLKSFCWNLAEDDARKDYARECGCRNQEDALDVDTAGICTGLVAENPSFLESLVYPWREVKWSLSFSGPALSNDPIAALCQDEADAVFYQKSVIVNGERKPAFALRGESLRGLVRTALARAESGLLTKLHDDCDCRLCRTFGNEHKIGAIRFEDMTAKDAVEKHIDHVSIDRFDGGVVEKYDDKPLVGFTGKVLVFTGSFWLVRDLEKYPDVKNSLAAVFSDIRAGLYPVGAKGGIGYGWIHDLVLNDAPEWLRNGERSFILPGTKENRRTSASEKPYPDLPGLNPAAGALYNPYYFLQADKDVTVDRKKELISHESFNGELLTGKITCTLKNLSPLMLPDVERSTLDQTGHKTSPFFRLGERFAIPGSQVRAAVSNVFEALTNSCFRVMKQKNYLSWRMDPGMYQDFIPGKVTDKGTRIRPMGPKNTNGIHRAIRLPLYDDPNVTNKIKGEAEVSSCIATQADKLENALETNRIIAKAARENQEYLAKLAELSEEDFRAVLSGWKAVRFKLTPPNKDIEFQVATLTFETTQDTKRGYCKITGPNNSNVATWSPDDNQYLPDWEDTYDYSFRLSGPPECLPNTQMSREFPRPGFTCVKDGKKYRITKRCERIFEEVSTNERYMLPEKIREQYRDILIAYRDNAENIAKAFRTKLPDENELDCNDLREGDLVYFKPVTGTKTVAAVIPVCISREADNHRIGERLPEKYRPCSHVCLEDCTKCDAKSCSLPLYREGTLTNGLCPACHLFGAPGYKGRLRFGIGMVKEGSSTEVRTVTLPLQERPRATWVLPKEIKAGNDKVPIPGRKFYLRHNGWKEVTKGKDLIAGEPIPKGKNNISSEAIMPGTVFTFDIHFENLHSWELGLLLYCIELEEGMVHMIGRGKPHGFGQVSITVDSVEERTAPGQWVKWEAGTAARDWNITWEGLRHLTALCGGTKEWFMLPHVAALRLLMKVHDGITARYPVLDEKNDANPPGYEQLKENGYKARKQLVVQGGISPNIEPWHFPMIKVEAGHQLGQSAGTQNLVEVAKS
jgi:CRISPR/Cas system CSM-associated protein Csm3 (group 7 of RAMP superfamily)